MSELQHYTQRGTQDCPIAFYELNKKLLLPDTYPHSHSEAELLAVWCGTLTVRYGSDNYTLRASDFLVLEPGTVHDLVFISDDAKWRHLMFSQDAVALPQTHIFQKSFWGPLFAGKLHTPRMLQPDHPAYGAVFEEFQQLRKSRMNMDGYKLRRFSVVVSICTILAPYCRLDSDIPPDQLPKSKDIRSAVIYIQNNLNQHLTLQAIAQSVHLHPNYLSSLFKKQMGETIFAYIARRRVEHAASLLRNEPLSVAQVCTKVGFGSESVFFEKFRKYIGISPLAYAKQHRKPY